MRVLLLAGLLLSACETTWPEGGTVMSSSGQRLCVKHRVPLVGIRAFQAPTHGKYVYLIHDAIHPYYGVAVQYCPNHIPQNVTFVPTDLQSERTTVSYCPLCEKEFWQRLSVPDEKAAITYVEGLPRTFGRGGGHAAIGPYDVSLRKGVWIVRCFLDDGRPITLRMAKKDGAMLDSEIPD